MPRDNELLHSNPQIKLNIRKKQVNTEAHALFFNVVVTLYLLSFLLHFCFSKWTTLLLSAVFVVELSRLAFHPDIS